jgi:hypothetical protein
MSDWINRLLCWVGIHDKQVTTKWEPSLDAPVVTSFEVVCSCKQCGNILYQHAQKFEE